MNFSSLSTLGFYSSKGIAQDPTPIETFDSGNAVFNTFSNGVANSTSRKSLFLRTKKFFLIGLISKDYDIKKLKDSSSRLFCMKETIDLMVKVVLSMTLKLVYPCLINNVSTSLGV